MEYIVRVVRAEAYDTTVIEASMDEESIMYLQTLFRTTVVAANNPIRVVAANNPIGLGRRNHPGRIRRVISITGGTPTPHCGVPMGSCGDGVSL